MPLLFLLCCWLALAPAMAQEQVDPAVQRALLQQDLLPALAARTQAAQARQAAAESWFAGDGAWREAFPGLSHAPLGDPGFLASTSWQIQQRARLRATELAAVPPDGLAGAQDDLVLTWRKQLAQACAAEEAADTLELRFLAGLQAALDLAPELADESVEPLYGMWAGLRTSADAEEPSPQALALAAAASQATQALEALRQQAWRAATVPGDPALIDAVREEARVVPDRWPADSGETLLLEARVDRLRRVAPLLSADLAEDVDDLARQFELLRLHAEKASLEDQLAEADQVASDDLPIAQLEQQVRALHVSLEAAREEAGTILIEGAQDGLHQEVAQLRVWLTEKRLAAREAGLERARRLATTGLDHGSADGKLAEARRKADLARQQVEDEVQRASQAEAALRLQLADLRQEIAERFETEATRREAAVVAIDAMSERFENQTDSLASALALPPLDPQRQARIDESFLALRGLVDDLRRTLDVQVAELELLDSEADERLEQLRQQDNPLDMGVTSGVITDLLAAWQDARVDLEELLRDRDDAASDEVDAVLHLLRLAKDQRRRARGQASASARQEVTRTFLPELVAELGELPVRVGAGLRHAGPWLRGLPAKVVDLGALWLFLAGSVELLLLLLVWAWLRRAAPHWVGNLLLGAQAASHDRDSRGFHRGLADAVQRWLEPGQIGLLAEPGTVLARAIIDVAAAWQLARFLSDTATLVAFAAWAFAALVLWRSLPAVVPAVLGTTKDQRPVVRSVQPATLALTLWSLRAVVGWWLAVALARWACLRVLEADRLLDLVGVLATLAFWALMAVLLHGWSATMVAALGERPDSRLVRWASRGSASWVLRTLYGGTAMGLLGLQMFSRYASRFSAGGPRLSWLAALVARRQLRDAAEHPGEPLPDDLRLRLQNLRPPLAGLEQTQRALEEQLVVWLKQRRRGLRVLQGDRGSGKSALVGRLARSMGRDRKVSMLVPERRLAGPDAAREWLATSILGRSPGTVPPRDELIDEISLLPGPRVFLVDGMEQLFLRQVGGFEALRVALQVMHATSDEHFWVCGFHGPTWGYLCGVPGVFDPAFFDTIHILPAAGPDDLARWLGTTAQQADRELSFDALAGIGPSTVEAERLRRRARAAFWRLLADSAAGNPQVARELWLSGLSIEGEALRVGLFSAPSSAELQDLSDNELFVLTAVVVHDRLTVGELSGVLNLPRSGVRPACQRLVARGVLASDGFEVSSTYRVCLRWLPAVERQLRLKNFLHAQ